MRAKNEVIISLFGKSKNTRVNAIAPIDVCEHLWCSEAVLFAVTNGKGALSWDIQIYDDAYYGSRYRSQLMLNGKPILQADKPSCPTCAGLIAVGYGIENVDCSELKEISEAINAEYAGLNAAFNNLTPLLGLLQSGLYLLADCTVFPSDGNGHFFWDVPNELTENPATACVLTEDYHCVLGIPAFLYPSQSTVCFNPERVDYYRNLLSNKQKFPRAIAYFSDELSSVLLDGHHKASACASIGVELPCLVIMPCSGVSYKPLAGGKMVKDKAFFGSIEIDYTKFTEKQSLLIDGYCTNRYTNRNRKAIKIKNYGIIKRDWETCYSESHKKYPGVADYAEGVALGIQQVTPELIESCFAAPSEENLCILRYAIQYLLRTDKEWALKLALRAARLKLDYKLRLRAFKTLVMYKGNEEVEQLFVDHLLEDSDSHSVLRGIADSYWDDN